MPAPNPAELARQQLKRAQAEAKARAQENANAAAAENDRVNRVPARSTFAR